MIRIRSLIAGVLGIALTAVLVAATQVPERRDRIEDLSVVRPRLEVACLGAVTYNPRDRRVFVSWQKFPCPTVGPAFVSEYKLDRPVPDGSFLGVKIVGSDSVTVEVLPLRRPTPPAPPSSRGL